MTRLLHFLGRVRASQGRLLFWSTLNSLALALSGGGGLLLLVPLLHLVGAEKTPSPANQAISNWLHGLGIGLNLTSVLLAFVALQLLAAWLERVRRLQHIDLSLRFAFECQQELHRALAQTSWLQFAKLQRANLLQTCTEEIRRISAAAYSIQWAIAEAALLCAYFLTALVVAPVFSLAAASVGLACLWVIRRTTGRALFLGDRLTQNWQEMFAATGDFLDSAQLARCYQTTDSHASMYLARATELYQTRRELEVNSTRAATLFTGLVVVALAILCYVAIGWAGIPASSLIVLIFVFNRMASRLGGLEQVAQRLLNDLPALERVRQTITACQASHQLEDTDEVAPVLASELVFEQVRFAYPGEKFELRVDQAIPARKLTVLSGPSGVGKSTALSLVLGLIRPDSGRLLVDGQPLQPGPNWRRTIGYLPQHPFLFHQSIRANLHWGASEATEEDLWSALEQAEARDFVEAFAQGLDTVVGERGDRLSGGQRQRLALARALLRQPQLLLLDEPTSGLDEANEVAIFQTLKALSSRLTVLVVSHRTSAQGPG
ncbi:MAG: ATP-binding cassette domain-containing protein [Vulcanimicrobiota bacterium]